MKPIKKSVKKKTAKKVKEFIKWGVFYSNGELFGFFNTRELARNSKRNHVEFGIDKIAKIKITVL